MAKITNLNGDALRQAMNEVIAALNKLNNDDERRRLINSVSMLFGLQAANTEVFQSTAPSQPVDLAPSPRGIAYSKDLTLTPKEFLREKSPETDVERIACLAYYLTHYRNTPHFKTLELSQLNTEAAQRKFSNATGAAKNATTLGYLAPATKGLRQISAAGEEFVRLLPDRESAKTAMTKFRKRKKKPRRKNDKT